jgi:hypothetical protein
MTTMVESAPPAVRLPAELWIAFSQDASPVLVRCAFSGQGLPAREW